MLSGHIAFNDHAPDLQYRGLELRDVADVETCGERDNCDTLYIAGFKTEALAQQAMSAARLSKSVTVNARQVWNMESQDLVIDTIDVVD